MTNFQKGFLDTLQKVAENTPPPPGEVFDRTQIPDALKMRDPAGIVEKPETIKNVTVPRVSWLSKFVPYKTVTEQAAEDAKSKNKNIANINYNNRMYYDDDVAKARALATAGIDPAEYSKYHGMSLYDFGQLVPGAIEAMRSNGEDPAAFL